MVAIIVHGGTTESHRDVVLRLCGGGFQWIYETNPLYDPLQYPLKYLRGELGWSPMSLVWRCSGQQQLEGLTSRTHGVSASHQHPDVEYSLLHRAGRLMQQWCVDMGANIIEQRLFYYRCMNSQQQFRRELLSGLQNLNFTDHIMPRQATPLNQTVTHVLLSASFQGSERFMRQQCYHAMAIVQHSGKPDLFVTVTCNPKWPGIAENLLPGQAGTDRPDLAARVFNLRLRAILAGMTKNEAFGKMETYVYVIEFQKRGLPHAHILLILKGDGKLRNAAAYDKFASAEISDPIT
jgi:hypothetical protein